MKKKLLIAAAAVLIAILLLFIVRESTVIGSLPDYDGSDRYYSEGFQDYTDYCKYYFSEDSNIAKALKESKYFRPVTGSDIEEIKSYFDNFEGWVEYEEYKDEYDFEADRIDTSDYFYIENKDTYEKYSDYPDKYSAYNVYFFDTQAKTLFFIQIYSQAVILFWFPVQVLRN